MTMGSGATTPARYRVVSHERREFPMERAQGDIKNDQPKLKATWNGRNERRGDVASTESARCVRILEIAISNSRSINLRARLYNEAAINIFGSVTSLNRSDGFCLLVLR